MTLRHLNGIKFFAFITYSGHPHCAETEIRTTPILWRPRLTVFLFTLIYGYSADKDASLAIKASGGYALPKTHPQSYKASIAGEYPVPSLHLPSYPWKSFPRNGTLSRSLHEPPFAEEDPVQGLGERDVWWGQRL